MLFWLSFANFPFEMASTDAAAELNALEGKLSKFLFNNSVQQLWINITLENETWTFHHIKAIAKEVIYSNNEKIEKQDLLLVHGYGTTSTFAWRNIILPLSETYNVHAVDLPGFGRSLAPSSMFENETSSDELLNKYCNAFELFQNEIGLHRPYIVAHSFGGFLYTHCISRNPSLASKLLLSDVPGLLFLFFLFFGFGYFINN
jgi:pimeloyl-ACP methyl ester carboxylesterase